MKSCDGWISSDASHDSLHVRLTTNTSKQWDCRYLYTNLRITIAGPENVSWSIKARLSWMLHDEDYATVWSRNEPSKVVYKECVYALEVLMSNIL